MSCIQIKGGRPFRGEVLIQGSKNAALPIMAACVLVPGVTVLQNCPDISDVDCMCQILRCVGVEIRRQEDVLFLDASCITSHCLPEEYVTRMRSSVILTGAMLGRCREISLYYPGGCVIGDRPIDLHLRALEKLGACFAANGRSLTATAPALTGSRIRLPFPSVGATENVILAAVAAKGTTYVDGCATEPEIVALCEFLKGAGAKIGGIGSGSLVIEGTKRLSESCYRVEPDRIVAGTYLLGTLAAGGDVFLRGAPQSQMESVLEVSRRMGAELALQKEGIRVVRTGKLAGVGSICTGVYPGFPTDLQSPMLVALCRATGESRLTETIFNGRLAVAAELNRMGAGIRVEGSDAYLSGQRQLTGCSVTARELRGGAALVLAGACARGMTKIENRQFIDRGYEDIVRDLQSLGVDIGDKTGF